MIIVAISLLGCAPGRRGMPLAAEFSGSDEDSQVNYWLAVTERPIVSNDEAFHGLLLFIDGKDEHADYAARVAAMHARKMLPVGFDEPLDAPARRGTLAVAIAKVLEIRGGLFMRISSGGLSRYALRELVYRGVFPPSSENQTFSGVEFAGVIGKVEDFQRAADAKKISRQ